MASKPSIPAWQRLPVGKSAPSEPPAEESPPKEGQNETNASSEREDDESSGEPGNPGEHNVASELEQVEALLEDPSLKNASTEKKRAFLESKSVPVETIDLVVSQTEPAVAASDFAVGFTQHQQQQRSPSPTPSTQISKPSQSNSGPPIITYPEYLVEAHKPPPLITPARLLGASYIAGGLATLIYAANKTIVEPMVEALSSARHDFSSHSQSKLDEFNERLGKIVSKIPEPMHEGHDLDLSEIDSIVSDPTELYHRDMGTQTSPPPSRRPSTPSALDGISQDGVVGRHIKDVTTIKDRLTELVDGMENSQDSDTERQEELNKLRLYLDTLLYSNQGINIWSQSEDLASMKQTSANDSIEDLKKEIRNVKGVLLSASRFP